MIVYYNKEGQRWLYSFESNDIVGVKDPDGSEKIFVFTEPNTEPVKALRFDTEGYEGSTPIGLAWWSDNDDTLTLQHSGGVRQQLGEETYMRVVNRTGATIPNGCATGFYGVNGDQLVEVTPYIADGTMPQLYVIGIATEEIADGGVGRVTVWGRVRDLDTTAWAEGDILYFSPDEAGKLTNVKPTAPNVCVPVAAVLVVDETAGEIFVRPTIEQQKYYGQFVKNTDMTPAAINTAYAIPLDTTIVANGVTIVDNTKVKVATAGLYQFTASYQISSGSANAKNMWVWFSKNGTAVANTSFVITSDLNSGYSTASRTETFALDSDEYIELMLAVNNIDMKLDAVAATAFAPAAPAIILDVVQIQH